MPRARINAQPAGQIRVLRMVQPCYGLRRLLDLGFKMKSGGVQIIDQDGGPNCPDLETSEEIVTQFGGVTKVTVD